MKERTWLWVLRVWWARVPNFLHVISSGGKVYLALLLVAKDEINPGMKIH
jgi:hypothetical protein